MSDDDDVYLLVTAQEEILRTVRHLEQSTGRLVLSLDIVQLEVTATDSKVREFIGPAVRIELSRKPGAL